MRQLHEEAATGKVPARSYFENTQQTHRKTPMPEFIFDKVAGLQDSNTNVFLGISFLVIFKNTFYNKFRLVNLTEVL